MIFHADSEVRLGNSYKILSNNILIIDILLEDRIYFLQVIIFFIKFDEFNHHFSVLLGVSLLEDGSAALEIMGGLDNISPAGVDVAELANSIGLIGFEVEYF